MREKRKLDAPAQYCSACGTRHLNVTGVPVCRNRLCRKKEFTLCITEFSWEQQMSPYNQNFLRSLRIAL